MLIEASILGLAAATPALFLAHLQRRLGDRPSPAEPHWLPTPDGARLALYRFRPANPVPGREPVLMISGFGINGTALDFDDRFSWARRLAAEGFEAWILEVRGSGRSRRANAHDGSFDDYLVDARSGLAYVLATTGAEKLHWVGYSLGGVLLYATLGTEDAGRIRSGVTLESPVTLHGYPLDDGSRKALAGLAKLPWRPGIPYKLGSRLAMPLLPRYYETPMFRTWMNLENIDRELLPAIVYRLLDDVPLSLVLQFALWMEHASLPSMDGTVDHLSGLANCKVPIQLITGASDFARRSVGALERLKGCEVSWVLCLEAHGFSADYGHTDLIFGKRAPEEVFPHALNWLLRHDPAGIRAIT